LSEALAAGGDNVASLQERAITAMADLAADHMVALAGASPALEDQQVAG